MPNRILKESICTSETINELAPELEAFFYRLIVQCDDFGRFDARPSIIRARCYPLRVDKITEKQITAWLDRLTSTNLIQIYLSDGKQYLRITTWDKHQQMRAKRSKYPDPDIICNQLISSDSICHRIRESESESESNPNRVPETKVSVGFALPDWIDKNIWNAFLEMRKRKRKPATDWAKQLIVKKLEKFKNDGESIDEILNKSILKTWEDVYSLKDGGQNAISQKVNHGHPRSAGQGDSVEELERFANS